eukprot:Pompholyxophrys_punicea_v1_NODE_503_length_1829_cov_7.494927.p1 type:complete len:168 gc:universal NODE_503_length_1829_cov_7.494927:441-944(+)
MKKWKFFYVKQPNCFVKLEHDLFQVVSAAMNAFRPALAKDKPEDKEIAEEMLRKLNDTVNPVYDRVQQGTKFSSRTKKGWSELSASLHFDPIETASLAKFPKLTANDLTKLTCGGSYQWKQAECYTAEHSSKVGQYSFSVHSEATDLLRVKIQSLNTGSGLSMIQKR